MSLIELSKKIQQNPDQLIELLSSFRTTSSETRDFLLSLKNVPAYIVPALIETFAVRHRENFPMTIRDLMSDRKNVGSIFVLVRDDSDWNYVGVSTDGKALCRPFNSEIVTELDPSEAIRYVF